MKTSPPNMWYMNSTRVTGNQGAYCVMNPSRITAAGKLPWRTMKYGSAAMHGRVAHQIHRLPRYAKRETSGSPVKPCARPPENPAHPTLGGARDGHAHR